MSLTVSVVIVILTLLICVSATYNAYLLRGGKLALSEVLIAAGMVFLIFSIIVAKFTREMVILADFELTDGLFILGFILLLAASFRVRSSLK